MSKKVLFVATVLRGHILVFHLPYMQWFKEQGYEVHLCARNDTGETDPQVPFCDRYRDMPFERNPLSKGNLAAYRELKELIDQEDYALIHCHTPVGGMLARLAARRARRQGTKVAYTAHGFHFFSGAGLLNWLVYYPAERWLARYTDLLITINREDYARARRFPAKKVALVRGVGIDFARFEAPVDGAAVRSSLGVPSGAPLVITVGEHIPRKNHETVLRALARIPEAWLLFCGVGELTQKLEALARELGMAERTLFLGFRRDVPGLLKASDVFFFPSFQEGLPVSLMEAMAAGLPCVASGVRGNRDLIGESGGGTLRPPLDVEGFAQDITRLLGNEALRREMGRGNERFIQAYGLLQVREEMTRLYREQLAQGAGEA
ncbi:MAG: glycosyltransferase family 4 protein [Candidatus Limiplasma sp.]|nr:glycosyltransferase family 4 protein [Candidatus Limiplasma sp.]